MYSVRTVSPDSGTVASDVRNATDDGGKAVVLPANGPNETVRGEATNRTTRIVTRTDAGTCRSSVDARLTSAVYVPVSSAPAAARTDSVVGVTVPASDCVSHGATFGVYVTDDTNPRSVRPVSVVTTTDTAALVPVGATSTVTALRSTRIRGVATTRSVVVRTIVAPARPCVDVAVIVASPAETPVTTLPTMVAVKADEVANVTVRPVNTVPAALRVVTR